jgi:hypothetical protein
MFADLKLLAQSEEQLKHELSEANKIAHEIDQRAQDALKKQQA